MTTLTTDRLELKKIEKKDYEQIFKLFSNKKLLKYTDNYPHKTIEDTHKLIQKWNKELIEQKSIRWSIWNKKDNIIIGIISIYDINTKHKFASIGSFLDDDYQRRGLMPEARMATVDYAFNILKINRLEAQVFVGNKPSIKMLEKLGFKKEGKLRQNFMIDNKLEDSFVYSILKNDFK